MIPIVLRCFHTFLKLSDMMLARLKSVIVFVPRYGGAMDEYSARAH